MTNELLLGAIIMGAFVAGLVFLRYWRTTHDRFFLFFALSFFIESGNRLQLALDATTREDIPVYYLIRLVSYLLILGAILDKNFPRHPRGR